jgi:hypothetical protein
MRLICWFLSKNDIASNSTTAAFVKHSHGNCPQNMHCWLAAIDLKLLKPFFHNSPHLFLTQSWL